MRKLLLLSMLLSALLLLFPASSRAQYVVTGQGCGASGLNAIANDGTPVVCRGNPLVWTAVGGSSAGGGITSGSSVYKLSSFNVPGVVQYVCDSTVTNTSNVVTIPVTDVPFTGGTNRAAQVGDIVWAYNGQCGGQESISVGSIIIAQGTITSVDSATQIHTSNNATAGCTPVNRDNCVLVWGPDATTAGQNAFNAVSKSCGTLIWDMLILMQAIPTNQTSLCSGSLTGDDAKANIDIYGQGMGSGIIFSPSVSDFSQTIFSTQYPPTLRKIHDMFFSSFSPAPGGASTHTLFSVSFNSWFYNNWLLDLWPSASIRVTALSCSGVTAAITVCKDNIFNNSGSGPVISAGGNTVLQNNWVQGPNEPLGYITGANAPLQSSYNQYTNNSGGPFGFNCIGSGTASTVNFSYDVISCSGSFASLAAASGDNISLFKTSVIHTGTNIAINNAGTGIVSIDQSSVNTVAGTGNAINNAGTLILRQTALTSAGGVSLNNTGTVIIKEGNTFPQGITNTGVIQVVDGQGGYQGACTGVVTSATTVGLYGLGQTALTTCTSTTVASGRVMSRPGTVYALYCTATAGNQATDACTVVKNGAAQTMTCSLNAVAACTDGTVAHQVTYVAGDILGIEVIGGTGTTLANVKGVLVAP